MRVALSVMKNELRGLVRQRTALAGIVLMTLLTITATVVSLHHMRAAAEHRGRQQAAAQDAFDAQPDRHPHRVVHYGHFVYRLPAALAAFDPGVDPFTGSSMFLEGHRQNTANFGDVMQNSILTRFGQLTPAFALQILAPLMLVFLGHATLAQERQSGTLRQLLLQGASRRSILGGKLAALLVISALFLLPALLGLAALAWGSPGTLPVALTVMLGYTLYLAAWCVLITVVSSMMSQRRDALLALIGGWAVMALLVPRIAPDLAYAAFPLPDRLHNEVSIARDLRALGDSHDANDPYFAAFRRRVLDQYGVTRIEDLPVNYKGLLAVEGERLSSSLFNRYAADAAAIQHRQNRLVAGFAVLSPVLAIRQLSMAAAATDLRAHLGFLDQAEQHRYQLVQQLNQMQADEVSYADDTAKDAGADQRKRVDRSQWEKIPHFEFRSQGTSTVLVSLLAPLLVLAGWLTAALLLLGVMSRRLGVIR